jgi:hypothetical protein
MFQITAVNRNVYIISRTNSVVLDHVIKIDKVLCKLHVKQELHSANSAKPNIKFRQIRSVVLKIKYAVRRLCIIYTS